MTFRFTFWYYCPTFGNCFSTTMTHAPTHTLGHYEEIINIRGPISRWLQHFSVHTSTSILLLCFKKCATNLNSSLFYRLSSWDMTLMTTWRQALGGVSTLAVWVCDVSRVVGRRDAEVTDHWILMSSRSPPQIC
jgi:hypothetical protein